MAQMLLTSIWARLGNRSDHVDAGRKEIFHEVFSYAYVFKNSETPYLSAGPNDTGSVAQVGLCLPPTVKQRLMAYNSYRYGFQTSNAISHTSQAPHMYLHKCHVGFSSVNRKARR